MVGPADPLTSRILRELAGAYTNLGREEAALELAQKHLALCEKSLDESDIASVEGLEEVAIGFLNTGRCEESVEPLEKALSRRKELFIEEDWDVLRLETNLARAYSAVEKHQAALELFQRTWKKSSRVFGEDDPTTLILKVDNAITYGGAGQPEKGIPLVIKALDVGSRIGLDNNDLQYYKGVLERLQYKSANPPTTVPQNLFESGNLPDPERERISSRNKLRFWQKTRRRLGGPPS